MINRSFDYHAGWKVRIVWILDDLTLLRTQPRRKASLKAKFKRPTRVSNLLLPADWRLLTLQLYVDKTFLHLFIMLSWSVHPSYFRKSYKIQMSKRCFRLISYCEALRTCCGSAVTILLRQTGAYMITIFFWLYSYYACLWNNNISWDDGGTFWALFHKLPILGAHGSALSCWWWWWLIWRQVFAKILGGRLISEEWHMYGGRLALGWQSTSMCRLGQLWNLMCIILIALERWKYNNHEIYVLLYF